MADPFPHNTGQSHGCSTEVVHGCSKHPSNIHWTARHSHRRAFGGRKNVRRPNQIGADGHPRFISPDINITFLGFDFAFRSTYIHDCLILKKRIINQINPPFFTLQNYFIEMCQSWLHQENERKKNNKADEWRQQNKALQNKELKTKQKEGLKK